MERNETMERIYICPRCGKLTRHHLQHETQYTSTIIRRFWNCEVCGNLSDIQEIDTLKIKK
jgi:C4-type Zn-finger protein